MYQLQRLGARVRFDADEDTVGWIAHRTKDYFDWTSTDNDPNVWTVLAGGKSPTHGNWTRHQRRFPTGEFYDFWVNTDRRAIVVDLPYGPWRSLYLLRIIRNVLRWELFLNGAIFLHAGGIANAGSGYALLGAPRSGKSTLGLHMLTRPGWAFIAEDDLTLIHTQNGSTLALGWPGCVRIRRALLHHFPQVERYLNNLTHPANELEQNLDPQRSFVRIFPEELREIFGCAIVPQAILTTCFWTRSSDTPDAHRMTPEEAQTRLKHSWDIVPDRKGGVRSDVDNLQSQDWQGLVFDPFLMNSYVFPNLEPHLNHISIIAQKTPCIHLSLGNTSRLPNLSLIN